VFSLLQACLEDANSKNPSQENQTAIEWTKQKFLQKTAYLLKANPYLMSDQITEVVTSYKHSIGDIEQRLPAEDPVIDEMLRSKTTISTPVPPITSEVKSNYESDEMNEETQDKLLAWLASNLNLPLSSISKEISFSELGLDSISAVSLSQAIQEMWNIEIDPTIAWDFPTVNLLSKYLTSEKMRRENKRINLKGQSESIVSNAQASSYLNLITEEEATVQLSEELRKLSFR
jgi:acyl carrier protein